MTLDADPIAERRRIAPGLWFAAPATTAIVVFFFVPVAASLVLSFTDFDIYAVASLQNLRFVALRNYARLLHDPLFWTALGNTFYFVGVGVPLTLALSLGTALLLDSRPVRFQGLFRTLLFLPVVSTLVAVAVVWRYVYHPRFGLLNQGLVALGLEPIDWLGDPRWAMPAIIVMAAWKNFGFNMIVLVAALRSIPESLYEAARLDGASDAQQLRHVTLPMLGPALLFVSVITVIGYCQLFAEPYVMTQGGPSNRTLSIVLLMYEQGFRWWNMGYAAAVAFVLFVIVSVLTLLQRRLS